MALTERENYLRCVRFQQPEWIPFTISINTSMWHVYGRELERLVLRYPDLFPHHRAGNIDFDTLPKLDLQNPSNEHITDNWGCTWVYPHPGMDGCVVAHPLADAAALAEFVPPVPDLPNLSPAEWQREREAAEAEKRAGKVVSAGTEHGFLFLRHTYLRGFENAMLDYALDEPFLPQIYEMILDYWLPVVEHHVRRGVDVFCFAEDLGTQNATILSPEQFRKWIKPAYARLMRPCKEHGVLVYLHSDGKTLDILEDQIAAGVDIVNPQDLCNGIDALAQRIKGKACIQLDIDRQFVIPRGTPADIDALIREEVMKLGSKQGGLMMIAGVYPPTPLENLDALCQAARKYQYYWA